MSDKIKDYKKFTEDMIELLKTNHNLILTGAPGTGKTFLAKDIAKRMIFVNRTEEELEISESKICLGFVQFHPSYDYTDFVEGLRPINKEKGNEIGFELKNGIFKEFCMKAKTKNYNKANFVFIIDEINRGEISKIFGELFFSIDPGYRGKAGKVKTQYANMQSGDTIFDSDLGQGWFYIPENVYIIGSMNDIDRSVESFDFAMRRRFVWQEISAEQSAENMGLLPGTKGKMRVLNEAISDIEGLNASYHIGAAYFRKEENGIIAEPDYAELWRLQLKPLLGEYLRGMPEPEEKLNLLKQAYDG